MFKIRLLTIFILFIFFTACTVINEPAAEPIAVERPSPTNTPTLLPSLMPTNTHTLPTSTPVPTSVLSATTPILLTSTPFPTYTPYPPTPTPSNFYSDIWVRGFLINQTKLLAGYNAIPDLIYEGTRISLKPADLTTAEQLQELSAATAVKIEGDFYYNGSEDYWLVVKKIEMMNLPYSTETPLDATYTHTDPDITFDYPADWFVVSAGVVGIHNISGPVAQEQRLWPESYGDITGLGFTVQLVAADSVEAYVNEKIADPFCERSAFVLDINGRSVTGIGESCSGARVEYVFSVNEQIFTMSGLAQSAEFMERVLATVR